MQDNPSATDPLSVRLEAAREREPGTVEEIKGRHKANVMDRAAEAAERFRHVAETVELFEFSEERANRWHQQECRDPYYDAARALRYGDGIYWGLRQLRDKLTDGEREVLFAVKKELIAEDPEISDRRACRIVADRDGRAYGTVRELYRRATNEVEKIIEAAVA